MKKTTFPRFVALAAVAVAVAVLASGCASIAVSGDAIEQNTARALALAPGAFTVSNRKDDGIKTTYDVTTNAGRRYSCYVTGSVAIVGRVVSDAMCTELGGGTARPQASSTPAPAPAASCNALLRAAGQCK